MTIGKGIYLTDLTFIEDGNPTYLENNLVNFFKQQKIATVIQEIKQYQCQAYSITELAKFEEWLSNLETVGSAEAYNLSLKVEPRNAEEAIEKMLMEEERLREQIRVLQVRNVELEVSSFLFCRLISFRKKT